jgi:hypothetical protein
MHQTIHDHRPSMKLVKSNLERLKGIIDKGSRDDPA